MIKLRDTGACAVRNETTKPLFSEWDACCYTPDPGGGRGDIAKTIGSGLRAEAFLAILRRFLGSQSQRKTEESAGSLRCWVQGFEV